MNEYVVVKYVHDEIRAEPMNIGIILRSMNSSKLFTKFFENLNQILIRQPMANIELIEDFTLQASKIRTAKEGFLQSISDKYAHQIQFSEVLSAKGEDAKKVLERLYDRFVSLKDVQIVELVGNLKMRTMRAAESAATRGLKDEILKSIDAHKSKMELDNLISLGVKHSPTALSKDREFIKYFKKKPNLEEIIKLYLAAMQEDSSLNAL